MHAHDCPSIPYVNPFIPCALSFRSLYFVLSFLLCSCFMLYNSNSILLFFTNHAFFKYNKPINMKLYHSTLHNLNPNRSSHSNTLKIILHISSIHHFITSLILFEHSWNYSNQPKQIYSTYSWFGFIKQIFCYSNKHKNNSFSVSKISPGCIGLTTPTLHWRTHWSLQWWHDPANTYNIRLRYGTLHPRTHRLPACSHVSLPVSMSS